MNDYNEFIIFIMFVSLMLVGFGLVVFGTIFYLIHKQPDEVTKEDNYEV